MGEGHFIDKFSYILAFATLLASFVIFYRGNKLVGGSLVAAVMTAGLVWATYLILRWLLLANRQ